MVYEKQRELLTNSETGEKEENEAHSTLLGMVGRYTYPVYASLYFLVGVPGYTPPCTHTTLYTLPYTLTLDQPPVSLLVLKERGSPGQKGFSFTLRINLLPERKGSKRAKKPATESRSAQGGPESPNPSTTALRPPQDN